MKYPLRYPLSRFLAKFGVNISIQVNVEKDEEAGVYVATSDDLPGLVLESESLEELRKEIGEAIPVLLELEHTNIKTPIPEIMNRFAHP